MIEEVDVFLSYSRTDAEFMLRVRNYLKNLGIQVWVDEGIAPGEENWQIAIEKAIRSARAVVVLLSPNSVKSKWVREELGFAQNLKKKIFPILIKGDETDAIPFGLSKAQWIDLRRNELVETGLDELYSELQKEIEKESVVPPKKTPVPTEPGGGVAPPSTPSFWDRFCSILLLIAIPTLFLPILFHMITGRNVLFTGMLFSETALPPEDAIKQVFDMETGKLFDDESPLLQISAIRYEYANGSQELLEIMPSNRYSLEVLPIEWGKEGWKIRLEHLLEDKLQEGEILAVPSKIQLVVDHLQASDNLILVYILTDEVYLQQPALQILPLRRTKIYRNIYIGQPGVINFIDLNDYSVTLSDSPNMISPGVGPIAAIFVVEFENNEPKHRSNLVFVKRKGIVHPNDIWFSQDENLEPYITFPLTKEGDRMIAFQSPESDSEVNDIFISRLDGSGMVNIAPTFFRGSEEVICGWGDSDGNYNTLYFLSSKEGGNKKTPYKAIFSNDTISKPSPITNYPQRCTSLQ